MSRLLLSEKEYLDIEDELLTTAKGRAFLFEFRSRNEKISIHQFQTMANDLENKIQLLSENSKPKRTESDVHLDILRNELHQLASSIVEVKKHIASLQPKDSSNNRIVTATEELDAIISSTEQATAEILTAAETIFGIVEKVKKRMPNEGGIIEEKVTEILMACSFQDITGQRISKVVNALKYIEQRVNSMVSIWGVNQSGPVVLETAKVDDERPDAHLLNGPQLEGKGRTQDDIDALFDGGFDIAETTNKILDNINQKPEVKKEKLIEPDVIESKKVSQDDIDALFG